MSFISIEGNIGAGKSTLVDILKKILGKELESVFLQEPVDTWLNTVNEEGKNILDLFYNNQERWSYSFQMNAFITRLKLIEKTMSK